MLKKNPAGLRSLSKDVNDFVEKVATSMKVDSKKICPVDTGALRASIDIIKQDNIDDLATEKFLIGSDLYYAGFVEEGTRNQNAQPYLKPVADDLQRYVSKNRKRT